MKLGRCVVGTKLTVEFEHGCGMSIYSGRCGWCDPIACLPVCIRPTIIESQAHNTVRVVVFAQVVW